MKKNNIFIILVCMPLFVIFPLQANAETLFDFAITNVEYQSSITASGAQVSYDVTATSGGNPVTPICTPSSGSLFHLGENAILCSASDTGGNIGYASFIITVSGTDSTPPNITAPPNITKYTTDPGSPVTVNIGEALVNDNADPSPLVINNSTGSEFFLGDTFIRWLAFDHSGNSNSAIQKVTIKEFVGVNVTATPSGGLYNSIQNIVLSANETVPIYYTVDGETPTIFSAIYNNPIPVISNMTLTYFATPDEDGNPLATKTDIYTIDVDVSPPVITLTGSNPVYVLPNTPYVDAGATALDFQDGNITPSIITSGLPVNTSVSTSHLVTYNVSDATGNDAAQVTRTVIVTDKTALMTDTTASSGSPLYPGIQIHAEYVTPTSRLVGDKIDSITLKFKKNNTPTGTVEVGIFNTDLSVKKSFGTMNISSISGSFTDYTFSLSGETYTIVAGDRIGLKFTGVGDATTNNISVMRDSLATDPFDGTNSYRTFYDTTWKPTSGFTEDLYMILKGPTSLNTPDDSTPPVITLLGSNPVNVQLNSNYVDAGATALDNRDGSVTPVIIADFVNTSVLGSYPVTFNVSDAAGNAATQITRTVNVVDIPPTVSPVPAAGIYGDTQNITLVPSSPSIIYYTTDGTTPTLSSQVYNTPIPINTDTTIKYFAKTLTGSTGSEASSSYIIDTIAPVITLNESSHVFVDVFSSYSDAGATATDNLDGNLTSSIITSNPVNTSVLGSYPVTFNVSDTAGNPAEEVTRTVDVVDQTPPVITLLGSNPTFVLRTAVYSDAGATANDNYDGDLTSSIVTTGIPDNTEVIGIYPVTYNVSDNSLNVTPEVIRYVHVIAANTNLCSPPISGTWTISTSCTLTADTIAPGNVIVQSNSVLTIPSGITLDINFSSFNLIVKSGSSVIVKSGGTIE